MKSTTSFIVVIMLTAFAFMGCKDDCVVCEVPVDASQGTTLRAEACSDQEKEDLMAEYQVIADSLGVEVTCK